MGFPSLLLGPDFESLVFSFSSVLVDIYAAFEILLHFNMLFWVDEVNYRLL
jgi:hypothetical protein